MKSVLIPLADGVEEMEAVTIIDGCRRVPWTVTSTGIKPGMVTASRGVRLMPDAVWAEIDPSAFDILIIPGGQAGTEALSRDERVIDTVRLFMREGKWIAAICAGPLVLQAAGVLAGRQATCHPAVTLSQTRRLEDRVVVDNRLITSQGPGSSLEFVLEIIKAVENPERAADMAQSMIVASGDYSGLGVVAD